MARTQVPVTEITPAKASLTTALTGANNDLKYTAKKGGSWGNAITVAYIVAGTNTPLSVQVDGFAITVNVATNAVPAATSTSAQVAAAVQASLDASSLVDVANAGSDDGTGVVVALSATALSGGIYGTTLPAVTNGDATNDHYFTGNSGDYVIRVVSTDAGAQTVTIRHAPRAITGVVTTDEVVSVAAGATVELGPFLPAHFNQNSAGDVYFDPSVSNTLDFLVYKVAKAT